MLRAMHPASIPAGLCAACRYARRVTSQRGSTFVLCRRSETDPRFARYPRLPVIQCPGFERAEAAPDPTPEPAP